MSIIVFQHEPNETPAVLGSVLRDHGHKLRIIKLFAGDKVPVDLDDVDAVVSMGGNMNVEDAGRLPWLAEEMAYLKRAHEANVPMVGVCLGMQLIAAALGGEVKAMMGPPELGWFDIRLGFPGTTDPIYAGVPWKSIQFHMHGQEVTKLPANAVPLAGSAACKVQSFRVGLRTYGFQYHFEWDRRDLILAAQDPFFANHGADVEGIIKAIDQHYENYRRLGNRLAQTIAMQLFPIDKRKAAV